MAAPMDSKSNLQNPSLIDEMEASFVDCLSLMTSQDPSAIQDVDESKTSVENAIQKFLELSRKTEAFFLRKRMLVSFQKPEQLVSDDNTDLRLEIMRKDQLLERHQEKLRRCQLILKDRDGAGQAVPVSQATPVSQQQQQQPPVPQQHPSQPPTQSLGSHPSQAPQVGSHISASGGSHLPQYSQQHHMTQINPQVSTVPGGQGSPYQSYQTTMHGAMPPGAVGPQQGMQTHGGMALGPRGQPPPSYPQNPLAFLEQTTSNIGMPDGRR